MSSRDGARRHTWWICATPNRGAGRPAPRTPPSRHRAGRAYRGGLVSITVVALLLGILGGVLTASRRQSEGPAAPQPLGAYRRPTEVANLYAESQARLAEAQVEVEQLRERISEYERAAGERSSLEQVMSAELTRHRAALNLLPLKGPGLLITLDDSSLRGRPEGIELSPLLVQHIDLLMIVNELWTAGAEAIAINAEPVGPRPSIRSVGSVIYCNGAPVASPYVITALGNADRLKSTLEIPGGILEQLRSLGQKVTIEVKTDLQVAALRVTPKMDFAQPQTVPGTR